MDENSCENETSESADGKKAKETENIPQLENVGIKLPLGSKKKTNLISSRSGTSFDPSVSGPSNVVGSRNDEDKGKFILTMARVIKTDSRKSFTETEREENATEQTEIVAVAAENAGDPKPVADTTEDNEEFPKPSPMPTNREEFPVITQSALPCYDERQESQPRVRLAPGVEEQLATRRPSVGPPPSYSFVMKQKKKLKPVPSLEPLSSAVSPPPSYGSRGMFLTSEERMRNFPSFAEPIWRSHSQPALCPRCGIIVLTTTHTHDSVATHMAALALCLFGCWPCCLLPYCMNVCKNTYHHCPICQAFLGLYKPW